MTLDEAEELLKARYNRIEDLENILLTVIQELRCHITTGIHDPYYGYDEDL